MSKSIAGLAMLLSLIFQIIAIGCMIRFGVQTAEFGYTQLVTFGWICVSIIGEYMSKEETNESHHGN